MKVYFDKFRRPAVGVDLIWAIAHLVLRREPWILDLPPEAPGVLVGPEWDFPRYKGIVKRIVTSKFCRRIITSTETGKDALVQSLDNNEELERKVEVVYAAVAKKEFRKNYHDTTCRLLFVNSANLPGQFDIKGGKEALEAFKLLRQRYRNVELVVRSAIPHHIRQQYDGMPGLTFIEETLSWARLENEFLAADIFLLPAHFTPLEVFLDAMSYELPVVTTDVWGNRELIEDGRTGFLVPKSSLALDFLPDAPWGHSWDFDEVLKQVDPKMVDILAQKIAVLIENPELRHRMGRAGRIEVEEGRFSISRRNGVLKRILDEATGAKP
jgi:glycosyltransferase involved in cell wall biosynthesis